jgi:hypothetical protein
MTFKQLLEMRMDPCGPIELAGLLSSGVWTHDHSLMDLYPQPSGRQASVEYVPSPHVPVPPSRGSRKPLRIYPTRLKKNVDGASCP